MIMLRRLFPILLRRLSMTYHEKLQKYLKDKATVEILADKEITGVLIDVGSDYLAITHAVEREITEQLEVTEGPNKGTTEEQQHIRVIKFETILRLVDIRAVSKIVQTITK